MLFCPWPACVPDRKVLDKASLGRCTLCTACPFMGPEILGQTVLNLGMVSKDASSKGCFVQGRIVQGTHCPRDGTYETFCLGTHRSGTLIMPHRPGGYCREERRTEVSCYSLCMSNNVVDVKVKTSKDAANHNNILWTLYIAKWLSTCAVLKVTWNIVILYILYLTSNCALYRYMCVAMDGAMYICAMCMCMT